MVYYKLLYRIFTLRRNQVMNPGVPLYDPTGGDRRINWRFIGAVLFLIFVFATMLGVVIGPDVFDLMQPSRVQERQQQTLVVMGLYQQDIVSVPGCRVLDDTKPVDIVPQMRLRTSPDSTSATFVVSLRWVVDGLDGAVTISERGEYSAGFSGYVFHVECGRRADLYRVGNLLRNRTTGNFNRVPEILN